MGKRFGHSGVGTSIPLRGADRHWFGQNSIASRQSVFPVFDPTKTKVVMQVCAYHWFNSGLESLGIVMVKFVVSTFVRKRCGASQKGNEFSSARDQNF